MDVPLPYIGRDAPLPTPQPNVPSQLYGKSPSPLYRPPVDPQLPTPRQPSPLYKPAPAPPPNASRLEDLSEKAPYPKDFIKLWNATKKGYNASSPTGQIEGKDFGFWEPHVKALREQRKVYDYVNKQGLKNLPEAVQQHIAGHPQFEEWQHPPNKRAQMTNPDAPAVLDRDITAPPAGRNPAYLNKTPGVPGEGTL